MYLFCDGIQMQKPANSLCRFKKFMQCWQRRQRQFLCFTHRVSALLNNCFVSASTKRQHPKIHWMLSFKCDLVMVWNAVKQSVGILHTYWNRDVMEFQIFLKRLTMRSQTPTSSAGCSRSVSGAASSST